VPSVSVALPLPIRKNFTYRVPEGLSVPEPGTRVRVPFGERVLTGVVVSAAEPIDEPAEASLRDVLEVLDEEPVCPPEIIETTAKVAQRFFAAQGEIFKSALPARLPAAGSVRYRITEKGALAATRSEPDVRPFLETLSDGRPRRLAELPPEARPRREAVRTLEENGWIRAVSGQRRELKRPVV
jgi:primosomal protein N' (replication factor Y)